MTRIEYSIVCASKWVVFTNIDIRDSKCSETMQHDTSAHDRLVVRATWSCISDRGGCMSARVRASSHTRLRLQRPLRVRARGSLPVRSALNIFLRLAHDAAAVLLERVLVVSPLDLRHCASHGRDQRTKAHEPATDRTQERERTHRCVNVRWRVVVRVREHGDDRDENRLDAEDRTPSLVCGLLRIQLVLTRRVEDRDAHDAVRVHCSRRDIISASVRRS